LLYTVQNRETKRVKPIRQDTPPADEGWLDLDGAGVVEVTSEEKGSTVSISLLSVLRYQRPHLTVSWICVDFEIAPELAVTVTL